MAAAAVAVIAVVALLPGQAAAAAEPEPATCPEIEDTAFAENVTLEDWQQCKAEQYERSQKDRYLDRIDQFRAIPSWLDKQGKNLQESEWPGIRSVGDGFRDLADDLSSTLDGYEEQVRAY